jgi:phage protein D
MEIELEDVDGLWRNGWYPEKGARLDVVFGPLNCGTFEIDEIELKGPPDTVSIRGMATGIKNNLRTKKSDAHENKTLRQIAEKIAQKNGLTIQGEIPDITIGRVTQNKETDLAFLKRISQSYGILFSVRGKLLTFTSIYDIEKRGTSFVLDKSDLKSYSLKDKADGMVKAAKVQTKNAKKNEKVESTVEFSQWQAEEGYKYDDVESQDEAVSDTYAENTQQAEAKAKAIMHLSATNQQEGSISIQFHALACAGNNFTLTGLGKLSGKYHIKSSTHKIDRSGGGTSECEIKRLQTPEKSQQITKKKKKAQPNNVKVVNANVEVQPGINYSAEKGLSVRVQGSGNFN